LQKIIVNCTKIWIKDSKKSPSFSTGAKKNYLTNKNKI